MIRSRANRAFTLVEVLIATFIIALGVLGLLALFAGAARQQQTATQVTLAATAARNAEAIIGNNFGRLQNANLASGEWRPLPIASLQFPYLTVNPNCDPLGPYFLVDSLDPLPRSLYTWTETLEYLTPFPALFEFTGTPPPAFARDLRNIGQRRIDPDSVFIQVEVTFDPPLGQGTFRRDVYNYFRLPDEIYTEDSGSLLVFPRDGIPSSISPPRPLLDYITLDCQFSCTGTQPARIYGLRIDPVSQNINQYYISRIDLISYKWRNDQLVSLGDRVITRFDPTAPDQARPDIAYSLLFRKIDTASQMCVFTYQLTPSSSSARFVPPETEQILYGPDRFTRPPVRRADVNLFYDEEAKAYYITMRTDPEESLWALAPGQVLLVAQRLTPVGPGADAPVKVVRRERRITGANNVQWRGYLSDSPRTGNNSLLSISQRANGQSVAISVFGVNDVVRSLQDNSEWRLKPLEAFVFQVTGN
jgi:type II secretory pathway pseudopilin PulG